MKKIISLVVILFCYYGPVWAQADRAYLYFDRNWKSCNKYGAFYYGSVYKIDSLWGRKDYWVDGNILQMEGSYLEKDCKTPDGLFKWYWENGVASNIRLYEKGKTKSNTLFYKNASRLTTVLYKNGQQLESKGWDENGTEIPNSIYEKEAKFPGGMEGWRIYLEKNLNSNVAASANAPTGIYTVKVQFIVNKDGKIDRVEAISVPAQCLPCGVEAVRVIKHGPRWEPAVQYNRAVIYQAIQYVSFQVARL